MGFVVAMCVRLDRRDLYLIFTIPEYINARHVQFSDRWAIVALWLKTAFDSEVRIRVFTRVSANLVRDVDCNDHHGLWSPDR